MKWRVLFACLAVLACQPDGMDESRRSVAATPGVPLAVADTPAVTIGVAEGDSTQILYRVTHPRRLPNGDVVVPMGDGRIELFGSDGGHRASLGGAGEGPGEFTWLAAAWLRGDTLEAHDAQLQRITRFLGGEVDVVPLQSVAFMPSVKGPVDDGWILTNVANPGRDRGQRSRDTLVLRHHRMDGTAAGEVARIASVSRYSNADGRSVPEPLSPAARIRTHDGLVYMGQTLEARIVVVNTAGDTVRAIEWESPTPLPPQAAYEDVVERSLADQDPEDVADARRRLEAAPPPVAVSLWWDFIVDDLGFLWIRSYEPAEHAWELGGWSGSGPGGEWRILDPEGRDVGTVAMPRDLTPVQITRHEVVGVMRDALGVERVAVHALDRVQM